MQLFHRGPGGYHLGDTTRTSGLRGSVVAGEVNSTRANYVLRVVHPELSHGWMGLSAPGRGPHCRSRWAGWVSEARYARPRADTLSMIRARHPTVADDVVITLSANLGGLHWQGANICRRRLQDVGFDAPEWGDLSRGLRPGQGGLDEAPEPGAPRHGWQRVAAQEANASFFRGVVWPRLTPSERALSRSQGGPMAGLPFTCCPVVTPVPVRCPGFPGSSLAAPLEPTSFVRCKLPVWPSTRLAWPSPWSLSLGWGLGSQRVLLGECGRSGSSLPEC